MSRETRLSDRWIRLALRLFPRDFRQRQAEDLLDTAHDLLADTPAAQRFSAHRRVLIQLAKAGVAERLNPQAPIQYSTINSRHHSRSPLMDDLMHDLKSAFRSLSRRPGFAAMVIATLAIGLGTSAAMFGVVHGVLLEPLPFAEPDRLVTVLRQFSNEPGREEGNMSLPDLRDVEAETSGIEAIAGYGRIRKTWVQDGEPQLLAAGQVTGGLLRVFGIAPHLGRDLVADDTALNASKVVVLGYGFWQTHYRADPSAIGKVLMLSGEAHTIIGVAPERFDFPGDVQAWIPWSIDTEGCGRACHMIANVARLTPEADPQSTSSELDVLGAALAEAYPETNIFKRFTVRRLKEQAIAPVKSALWMLMGAVILVVLIASANVANLVLVRGSQRRKELAIRTAVGAGRVRLFRQLMMENGLLALGGAITGLVIGKWVLAAFLSLAPADLPRLDTVGLDANVFAFTMALSLIVLLIFGWAPALRMATVELRGRGDAGSRQAKQSRRTLLIAEVALTLVLLLGAGLLLRSFIHVTELDLGFKPDRVTRFSIVLPDSDYAEPEATLEFSKRIEQRLRNTPGIEAAGLAFAGPFGSRQITSTFQPLDRAEPKDGEELAASFDVVSPGFFETFGIVPTRGRAFDESDTRKAPLAVVVSRELAERYFPGQNPIGKQAYLGISLGFDDEESAFTIVGVVPDIRAYSLTDDPAPAVYMAQAQTASPYLTGFVRTHAGVDAVPAIREHMRSLDPMLPLRSIETQHAAIDEAYGPQRFYLALLGSFAVIALLLSAVGLYGVVAYLVSQRTRELAVRAALGADAMNILRLVLVDALQPAVAGVSLGLVGAWLGAKVLDNFLYGISVHDTVTYLAAPAILILFALLASLWPALRASRLEPRIALEAE